MANIRQNMRPLQREFTQENNLRLAADAAAKLQSRQSRCERTREALAERQQPLSELLAPTGATPTSPLAQAYQPVSQVAPADYTGAAYNSAATENAANQQRYRQKMSAYNSSMNMLGTLGGMALGGFTGGLGTAAFGGSLGGWGWGKPK